MEGHLPAGSSSSVGGVMPRLTSGGDYATWAPLFVNWCKRHGVGSVLTQEIKEWEKLNKLVQEWETERTEALMAEMLGGAASSSSRDAKQEAAAAAVEVKRAALKRMIGTSERVYAALFDALPESVRACVQPPEGYAFGLWTWLQGKFQCAEADSIGLLWRAWGQLEMLSEETYDEYRARVTKLHALLTAAKESVSPIHYTDVMLGRLASRYNPAALALRASDRLAVLADVDWDGVAAFINAHERVEQRSSGGAATEQERTMAAMQRGREYRRGGMAAQQGSGGRDLSRVRCWKCQRLGHYASGCSGGGEQSREEQQESAAAHAAIQAEQEEKYPMWENNDQYAFAALRFTGDEAEEPLSTGDDAATQGGGTGSGLSKTEAAGGDMRWLARDGVAQQRVTQHLKKSSEPRTGGEKSGAVPKRWPAEARSDAADWPGMVDIANNHGEKSGAAPSAQEKQQPAGKKPGTAPEKQ